MVQYVYNSQMINETIIKLIRAALLLEIRIRGTRIKSSKWRRKISENKYIQSHCAYPFNHKFMFPFLIADRHRKAAYLCNPKAAHTSIERSFLESESHREAYDQWEKERLEKRLVAWRPKFIASNKNLAGLFPLNNMQVIRHQKGWRISEKKEGEPLKQRKITSDELNSYFLFTFVRNPFSRLFSLFKSAYIFQNGKYYIWNKNNYNFWLYETSSLSEFIYKISKLPDFLLEEHVFPQHISIEKFYDAGGKFDFIGKVETLEQEFNLIRKKINLLPLRHYNQRTESHVDWRDHYTPQTAKLIYNRYRKDFEMFGYEDEYQKLLDYLTAKKLKKSQHEF